jgi:hypothetical protein
MHREPCEQRFSCIRRKPLGSRHSATHGVLRDIQNI